MTTLIALCLPIPVFAITPRLSTDVDPLILDGKKVSSSPLHGTDDTEPDSGPYQLVFHVEKVAHLSSSEERLYTSSPLMVSSNTQLIDRVSFRLPHLENEWETDHFNATPHPKLLGGDATPIPIKLDALAITSTAKIIDYKVEVEHYNKPAKRVSLLQFATTMVGDDALFPGVFELDATSPQSQVLTEQWLKYWLKLAGPQTRNIFLQWVGKQPSSRGFCAHAQAFSVSILQR